MTARPQGSVASAPQNFGNNSNRKASYTSAVLALLLPVLVAAPLMSQSVPQFGVVRFALAGAVLGGLLFNLMPRQKIFPFWFAVTLTGFIGLQLITFALSDINAQNLSRLLNWIMFVPLVFVRFRSRELRAVGLGIVAASLIVASYATLQLIGLAGGTWGGQAAGVGTMFESYETRLTSTLRDPNQLALALAVPIIILVTAAVSARFQTAYWHTGLLVALAGYLAFLLLETRSQSGLLALGCGIVVSLALARHLARRTIAMIVGLLCIAAVVFGTAGPIASGVEGVTRVFSGQDASAQSRFSLWAQYIEQNGLHPIGTGYGGYLPEASRGSGRLDNRAEDRDVLTVDNGWLKLSLEGGPIGAATLLGLIAAALFIARNGRRHDRALPATVAYPVAGAVIIVGAVANLFTDILDLNPWNAFLWIALSIAISMTGDVEINNNVKPG